MAVASLLMGVLVAVAVAATESVSDAEVLRQAEVAFRAGSEVRNHPAEARRLFREAATGYEKLRQRGCHNADLYRNQGNAYLLAGDLPQAILAYRRGLRLAPNDRILQVNLAYARNQVIYPESSNLGRPRQDNFAWLPHLAPPVWLILYVVCYSLAWWGMARWLMTQQGRFLAAWITAFCGAALLATALAGDLWVQQQESLQPLVVVAEDGVLLRTGNGLAYPPRYETPLNRGVEARSLFARGNWLHIELAGGQVGWVPRAYVLLDDQSATAGE